MRGAIIMYLQMLFHFVGINKDKRECIISQIHKLSNFQAVSCIASKSKEKAIS